MFLNLWLLAAQRAGLRSQFSLTVTPFSFRNNKFIIPGFSFYSTTEESESSGSFRIVQPIELTDGTISLINSFNWLDSRSETDSPINPTTTSSETFTNNLYISYQQPIFTYNRTKLNLRELELDLENSEINYSLQLLSLERQVTQNFFSVYQRKSRLEVTREELRNQEQSYDIIKKKVEAGLAAQEELYQAELNLANSQSKLQNEQVSYEDGLDDLKLLIGLPLTDDITVDATITSQIIAVNLEKALNAGLKYRTELRQRQIAIENSQFDLIQTAANNEFKGSITLTYGLIGNDPDLSGIYSDPTRNQDISLQLEIPLWDWGQNNSRIRASEATIRSNELSLEEEKNNIMIGIRKTYRSLANLAKQIDIAQKNTRNAQLTYDINLERYENGDLTSIDLDRYQTQLSQTKNNLVDALINYKLALLNLKIQTLWDFETDQPVIRGG